MDKPTEMKRKTLVMPGVCQSSEERNRLQETVKEYVIEHGVKAPLGFKQVLEHANGVLKKAGLENRFRDYTAVMVHNEVWRPLLANIPYDRRLLLLPKCLRNSKECKAKMDEFGLICAHCGKCDLHELITKAEELGYIVMVAEGSPLVMALIESGQVEAVVGVSCLSVLEKVFPYMEDAAIPGLAEPLLTDGCENTEADLDRVWEAIYLNQESAKPRMDLEDLRKRVRACFEEYSLEKAMGPEDGETDKISRDWLKKSGKRWRPFLTACVVEALLEDKPFPEELHKIMVAVEAYHKASLIHDDIEDEDLERYGEKTVHAEYGIPIALNAGDLLLGDGYRLIGEAEVSHEQKSQMLKIAAAGHKTLCLGQGAELCWIRRRKPLSSKDVIQIFRQKTAPAFEVALRLGAVFADADDTLGEILHEYSEALGVAYQIRDDLADSGLESAAGIAELETMGPSLLLAMAYEQAKGEDQKIVESVWRKNWEDGRVKEKLAKIMARLNVAQTARELLDLYKNKAVSALSSVENTNLKIALHRVVGKIFSDHSIMGCCNDYQTQDAGKGESSQEAGE